MCPSPAGYKRDYKQEARAESPARKKARIKRVQARRKMIAAGKASVGDGKTIDHKKPLKKGGSNSKSNLRVQSKSANSKRNGHKPGGPQGNGGRGRKKNAR